MLFRKTYTTPPASILPDHESKQAGEIYSGEELAKILSSKVPCSFVRAVVAPQLVSYHFALENPLELPKVKRLLEGVSAILHTEVKQASSDIAHFALEIPRADRSTQRFFLPAPAQSYRKQTRRGTVLPSQGLPAEALIRNPTLPAQRLEAVCFSSA